MSIYDGEETPGCFGVMFRSRRQAAKAVFWGVLGVLLVFLIACVAFTVHSGWEWSKRDSHDGLPGRRDGLKLRGDAGARLGDRPHNHPCCIHSGPERKPRRHRDKDPPPKRRSAAGAAHKKPPGRSPRPAGQLRKRQPERQSSDSASGSGNGSASEGSGDSKRSARGRRRNR